jgi:drug/metabolite transporter (DMT)-like permease
MDQSGSTMTHGYRTAATATITCSGGVAIFARLLSVFEGRWRRKAGQVARSGQNYWEDAVTGNQDRTLQAAGAILVYALLIAYADNYVRVIAADGGLWQFHATRAVIAIALIVGISRFTGQRLCPVSLPAVVARSAIHGCAMLIYFGCLAFLPVAQVAAGLFTAPIFVLFISRFAFGQHIGPWRIAAVAVGFVGVVLVLGPAAMKGATFAALLPVCAGALYAVGNVATREWCANETAETLLAGFFAALGLFGAIGLGVLAVWPVSVPAGAEGFVQRGWVSPSGTFLFWVTVQAVISVVGVGLMIKAYQIAEASRVSVFEYVILPASALWGWVLWSERPSLQALVGMGLITLAGAIIAIRARQTAAA